MKSENWIILWAVLVVALTAAGFYYVGRNSVDTYAAYQTGYGDGVKAGKHQAQAQQTPAYCSRQIFADGC